jgi:hypothetical protein
VAPRARTRAGRLRLAAAGAAIFISLTAAAAGAALSEPMPVAALAVARSGPDGGIPPRALIAGLVLDRGRFARFEVPGAPRTLATGINDHGQLVGAHENPTPPSPSVTRGLR